jgi:hypothetical protein
MTRLFYKIFYIDHLYKTMYNFIDYDILKRDMYKMKSMEFYCGQIDDFSLQEEDVNKIRHEFLDVKIDELSKIIMSLNSHDIHSYFELLLYENEIINELKSYEKSYKKYANKQNLYNKISCDMIDEEKKDEKNYENFNDEDKHKFNERKIKIMRYIEKSENNNMISQIYELKYDVLCDIKVITYQMKNLLFNMYEKHKSNLKLTNNKM